MICDAIQRLINYGITQDLITKADQFVVQNQLMEALQLTDWQLSGAETEPDASIDRICLFQRHYRRYRSFSGFI